MFSQSAVAQELSFDIAIFGSQKEPRQTSFDFYQLGGLGQLGFYYSDTLIRNWDYKVGLAYAGSTVERYYSEVEVEGLNTDNEIETYIRRVGDFYQSKNITLSLGTNYWPWQKRKGLYIPVELMPVIFIDGTVRKDRVENDNKFTSIRTDASDTYNGINVVFRTGIGYKLIVYRGLSISAAYNVMLRFGNVVKGVDDSFAFNRGISLIGGYKF